MAKQTTTTSGTHAVSPETTAETDAQAVSSETTAETDAQAVSSETTADNVKETEEHSTNTTKPTALKYVGEHRNSPIPLRKGSLFYGLPKILEEALEKDATLKALFVQVDSE